LGIAMPTSPETRSTLLVRIRDRKDGRSWAEFVEIYGPLVYGFLRKRGLQDADAADLVQDVLQSVVKTIHSFDHRPSSNSFRRWLFTIVQNRLRDYRKPRATQPRGAGDTQAYERLQEHRDETDSAEEIWDRQHELGLIRYAANQVRRDFQETTWNAFWQTAVEGAVPAEVARQLGMTRAAVYLAKARVLSRIREYVAQFTGETL
jgi:RNA polymerase sigma factor (sigma-70 family)